MTDDWEKAKKIFGEAINIAPELRLQFLDENCGDGDEVARREVESLLANAESAAGFLEQPAVGEVAEAIVGAKEKLRAGQSLSHYKIIRSLGAGGMGEVYLAKDKKLDRQVAVKILNEKFSRDESNLHRFIREAKAASALNHPNILVIHEIGEAENANYIISEFIEGATLRGIFKKSPMKLSEVLDIAIQIANALSAAHTAHIVHRDIKPENIMIRPDGFVKILDFGLAKLVEQKAVGFEDVTVKQNETAKGVIMGTVNYMSPEQAKGEQVDERTDIFSFGALVYEMIAGRTPFAGDTMPETFANLINAEPQPLAHFAANVPDELQKIVAKTLRKNKDERYQTMEGLLADLKNLRENLAFDERLEKSHLPGAENATKILQATAGDANKTTAETSYSFARQIGRHKPLAVFAVVVLLAAVGLGIWYFGIRPADTKQAASTKQIDSIAVLPFRNDSGETEYLSDGMTETLIGSLSQLSNLNVKARSAVFRYKGKERDAQEVGKELNVQTILTGRVAQRGDDLTLSLSLEDVETGNQIWGKQYNRKLTGIIALQTEIARDVSDNLKTKLSGADERRLAKNYTVNAEAYQLYLKGREHAGRFTPSEIQRAISFYQQAIELDPNYALAYVKLSNAYINLALSSEIPAPETMPKAKAAANRAIEIDDSLAEAHEGLSTIAYWYDWDLNAAERHVKRALELNPNSASIQMEYAGVLSNTGRHAESIPVIRRALELDPQNSGYQSLEGLFLIRARQYDEGLAILRRVRERSPSLLGGYLFAIPAYTEQGKFTEALALARQAREVAGSQPQAMSFLGQTLAIAGKPDEARAVLEEMLKLSKERHVSPYNIAMVYNAFEEREETFAQLERAYELREPRMVMLSMERKWDNLRSDPRFQDLLRRIGLPQ